MLFKHALEGKKKSPMADLQVKGGGDAGGGASAVAPWWGAREEHHM